MEQYRVLTALTYAKPLMRSDWAYKWRQEFLLILPEKRILVSRHWVCIFERDQQGSCSPGASLPVGEDRQ